MRAGQVDSAVMFDNTYSIYKNICPLLYAYKFIKSEVPYRHEKTTGTTMLSTTTNSTGVSSFIVSIVILIALYALILPVEPIRNALLLTIRNDSASSIPVYWYNQQRHLQQRQVRPGTLLTVQLLDSSSVHIGSHVMHSHEIDFGGSGVFVVVVSSSNTHPNETLLTHETTSTTTTIDIVKAWTRPCRRHQQMNRNKNISKEEFDAALQEISACLMTAVTIELDQWNGMNANFDREHLIKQRLAADFERYTCADDTLPTNDPVLINEWVDPDSPQQRYVIHTLHHWKSSRIQVIHDFISDEECNAIQNQAHYTNASTYDGKGHVTISESRKAMQAAISTMNLPETNPIHGLRERIFRYASHSMGINLSSEGQEPIMSIRYTGKGEPNSNSSSPPDQYLPHCDGDCSGKPHKHAMRVASMVMYCTIPTKGGSTNFRNAGVHVQGAKNQAIFFSYIDPITKTMDNGFTEHSGCPVWAGEKIIATEWIRLGVTKEVPWNGYNTLGERVSPELDKLRKDFETVDWSAFLGDLGGVA